MDPIIGGALISGASSLLGGLFGRKSQKVVSAGDNAFSHVSGIMKAATQFGFNPLTLLGNVSATGATTYDTGAAAMGSAIADAGLLVADGYVKNAERISEAAKLKEENIKLKKQVSRATLQPQVGGVYASRSASSRSRSVAPFPRGDAGSDSSSELRPLLDSDVGDPRRDVKNTDVKSEAGYAIVDNPHLGAPFRVPVVNDEMVGMNEAPILLASYAVAQAPSIIDRYKGRFQNWNNAVRLKPIEAERGARAAKNARSERVAYQRDKYRAGGGYVPPVNLKPSALQRLGTPFQASR